MDEISSGKAAKYKYTDIYLNALREESSNAEKLKNIDGKGFYDFFDNLKKELKTARESHADELTQKKEERKAVMDLSAVFGLIIGRSGSNLTVPKDLLVRLIVLFDGIDGEA